MPTYHVHMSYMKKGAHQGGVTGFARYLSRDGRDEASQFRRYLEREGVHQGKDDLVAAGHANLPRWAQGSAEQFWQAADTYERTGWVVARHLQVALPQELSAEAVWSWPPLWRTPMSPRLGRLCTYGFTTASRSRTEG